MTSIAATLPDAFKSSLLTQVKDQLGSVRYHQVVGALGEDGMLDILLQPASGVGAAVSPTPAVSRPIARPWNVAAESVLEVFGWMPGVWVFLALAHGWGGFVAVLAFFLLLYLGAAFFEALGALHAVSTGLSWIVGVIVGGAAILSIGYGLRISIPWIIAGVWQWWAWLASHI